MMLYMSGSLVYRYIGFNVATGDDVGLPFELFYLTLEVVHVGVKVGGVLRHEDLI